MEILLTQDNAKAHQPRPFDNLIAPHLIEKPFGILCPADGREFDEFQLVRQSAVIMACAAVTRDQGGRSWPNVDGPKVTPLKWIVNHHCKKLLIGARPRTEREMPYAKYFPQ